MTRWMTIVMACLVGVVSPLHARAQSGTSASIAGVAKDSTGAVLPGVTVEATSPALIEKIRVAVTDAQGQYKIVDLRPGEYAVGFSLPGFSTFRREKLELTTGFTASVNAEMKPGGFEETVVVSGASPVVDIQNVRAQTLLTRETLDALPTGKAVSGLATLTLGAVAGGAGAYDVGGNRGELQQGFGIHGLGMQEQKITLEGMQFGGLEGGGAAYGRQAFINQAAVQEMTLETSGAGAENETGGPHINAVLKDGGNSLSLYSNGSGSGPALQGTNLTPELRDQGVTELASVKRIYDFGIGLGGPIKRDRVWFYTAHRWWGADEYIPGNYFNKNHGNYVGAANSGVTLYEPDLTRPAYLQGYQQDYSGRVTWQASRKDKFSFNQSYQSNCLCFFQVDNNAAPEGTVLIRWRPISLTQVTWSRPATNRLLLEAGATITYNGFDVSGPDEVTDADISITELSTGLRYNAFSSTGISPTTYGEDSVNNPIHTRAAVSFVTGSHAFKVGYAGLFNYRDIRGSNNQAILYALRFGRPVSLTQVVSPRRYETRVTNVGLYAQDQWTIGRLTLNVGVRFDYLRGTAPALTTPEGRFVAAFDTPKVEDVPNWKDVSPRMGVSYDLFGNGKTAVKVSLGRYVTQEIETLTSRNHPANARVVTTSRTWSDANGNYLPDCDLTSALANGECGGMSARNFGQVNVQRRYADDVLRGFGVRAYNWQMAAALQHEVRPGVALGVSYFRTTWGNFHVRSFTDMVVDNLAVTPADYSPFCITAPTDARLGSVSGTQVCGLYDINPSKLGLVDELVTNASHYGKQTDIFNGVEVALNARFSRGGLLQGGVSLGRQATDNCFVIDSPQQLRPGFCDVTPPWSAGTQVKFGAIYPMPRGFQASATYRNLAGNPISANYVATNAEVSQSLGRNLGACRGAAVCNATVTVPLVAPNALFQKRISQLDLRLTKRVNIRSARLQGSVDLYNVFNASDVLNQNNTYGTRWLAPVKVMPARFVKFGVQLDF